MTKSIHLKEGKAYLDPIATAKTQHHWTNASKHNVITESPGSKTGKSNPDAPRLGKDEANHGGQHVHGQGWQ